MAYSYPFGNNDIANVQLTLQSATLTISEIDSGDRLYQFKLPDLIVVSVLNDTATMLRDGTSTITILNTQLTTLGTSADAISTAANSARASSGGGGGGDATAANQETIINNRLGVRGEGPASGGQRVAISDESLVSIQDTRTDVTPDFTRTSTTGTIAAGAYSFSVANVGNAAGLFRGQSLDPSTGLDYPVLSNNSTYASSTYDATGTTFLIIETR